MALLPRQPRHGPLQPALIFAIGIDIDIGIGIGIGIGFFWMKHDLAQFLEKKFLLAVGCDHGKGDESDCDSDTDSEVCATLRR